jgi:hypothetical protein
MFQRFQLERSGACRYWVQIDPLLVAFPGWSAGQAATGNHIHKFSDAGGGVGSGPSDPPKRPDSVFAVLVEP